MITREVTATADLGIPAPSAAPSTSGRYIQLDSLRGLAALTVFLAHFAQLFPIIAEHRTPSALPLGIQALLYSPLAILIAGQSAVVLFFVLSGLVLSLPFLKHPVPYPEFAVKRVFRIWLPYAVCLLICFGIRHFTYTGTALPGISTVFNKYITMSATPTDLLEGMTLIGFFRPAIFIYVAWSLVIEMRVSLIFPLVLLLATRIKAPLSIACAICLLLLPRLTQAMTSNTMIANLALTLKYVPCFMVGIWIAQYRQQLHTWWRQIRVPTRLGVLVVGIIGYTAPTSGVACRITHSIRLDCSLNPVSFWGRGCLSV